MGKVRIYQLARELGLPSRDLLHIAQELGYAVQSHANTLETSQAEELMRIINGVASAAYYQKEIQKQGAAPVPSGEPQEATATIAPSPAPAGRSQESLMLVNMGQQDVRVSIHYQEGFNNMVKVLAALLADLKQTVRTADATLSWGDLYFLRSDRSTPVYGTIELEYGGEGEEAGGRSQRQKGVLGDLVWTAVWMNEDWKRPFQKLSQVLGLTRDPEGDYRNQLEADLRALEARGRIIGLDEWEIDTSVLGRNILVTPKDECIAPPPDDDPSD